MEWEEYFSDDILKRGKEYFEKEKVKRFEVDDKEKSCQAKVLGTHIYNVKIKKSKYGYDFECDCENSKNFHCKHMAAVMYKWSYTSLEDLNEEYGFESDKDSFFFNIKKIVKSEKDFSYSDFEEAKELIDKGKIELTEVEDHSLNNGITGINVLRLQGTYHNSLASYDVSATISQDKIILSNCNYCNYDIPNIFFNSGSKCKHILALLLLADNYIAKYNPGDATDYAGSSLLQKYKNIRGIKKIDDDITRTNLVRIVPKVSVDSKAQMSVCFKAGIEKLNIIKNVPEFIEAREKFKVIDLAKNNTISFMDYDLTVEASKYFDFMLESKRLDEYVREQVTRLVSSLYDFSLKKAPKQKINLTSELIDKFYDISENTYVEFSSEGAGNQSVFFGKKDIRASVIVDKVIDEKGNFAYANVIVKMPLLFKGNEYNYFFDEDDGLFSRVDELSEEFMLLFEFAKDGNTSFRIGKKRLSEFYYRILPQLTDAPDIEVQITDREVLEENLPPQCRIVYYLDADDDILKARAVALYGDKEFQVRVAAEQEYPLPQDRDIEYEQSALDVLMRYFPHNEKGDDFCYSYKRSDVIYEILEEGLKELMSVGEVKATDEFNRLRIRKTPKVSIGVSISNGILDLDIQTDDMSSEELLELLESYRKKKKYHILRNGEFIRLERENTIEELNATMQSMGISAKEFTKGKLHLPLYRSLYINKLLEEHDEIAAKRDKNFKNLIRNFNEVKDSDFEVPESLSNTLREYQAYGFKWLTTLSELGFGGILADDMGLGKTLQVITFLLSRKEIEKENGKNISALIVCPASLVYNWEEEFKKFAPSIDVKTVTGSTSERKKLLSAQKLPEVLVTSYDLLKRDIGLYEEHKFDYEIIDEAQYIKNQTAAVSKAVKVIKSNQRFALTGTPIENRLSELWSIFDYLMPGFLYTYDKFKTDFENSITKDKDENAINQLKNMVSPFILRRLKENVLNDLPEKIEEIRFSKFESKQRKLYDAQVTHMKKILTSKEYSAGKDKIKVLAELTKIREICCDPSLITEGYTGDSAKRLSCMQLIESAIDGGHKILLFSQFTSMLELLEKDLQSAGIEYYKITGQTPKEDRVKLVHAFNKNEIPVFLISLKAGGTGLNLVGADVVIHYDPWWNLAAQNQATDRAHRMGQKKKVSVFKLIAKDTIEEKIVEMQNAKKDLADAILNGESESLMSMSKEQLIELLG